LVTQRNIVWIASYPKSGNTWVRFLACNLIFGPQNSAEALNALAPDIHEFGAHRLEAHSGLVKAHFPYSTALPFVERTAAAIYVVRRPEDVLVSNFHYSMRSECKPGASREALDRYVESFVLHRGDPRWIKLGMGSWEDNVRSWLGNRLPFPVLLIKYEDLSEQPKWTAARVAGFLNLNCAEHRIDQAVVESSFDRMREIESTDIREQRIGIFYKPYLRPSIDAGVRFMRQGKVGEGAALLTAQQRRELATAFESLTAQLGYSGHCSDRP